jgi:hypothetical protein
MLSTSNLAAPVPSPFLSHRLKYSKLSLILLIPLVVIIVFMTVAD